jgi:AhpD family alkylhydroperoxidase
MTNLISYEDAPEEVRTVYDDIKRTRKIERVSNFWMAIANHPPTLRRTWETLKEIMVDGALDVRVKEMIYLAISINNGCEYCQVSHGIAARKAGMTEEMFGELMAVVAMANETNKLVEGYAVPVDDTLA